MKNIRSGMRRRHSAFIALKTELAMRLALPVSVVKRALFFIVVAGVCGQSIQDVQLEGNAVNVRITAKEGVYYILLRGDRVTAINSAQDLQSGLQGTLVLSDPGLLPFAAFYRVREVPMTGPLDTDGDGLDDVCELNHRGQLNALLADNGLLDPDNDGRTTLEECATGTDPFVSERPNVPQINYPTNATTGSFVMFTGTAPANTLIRVEGGAAYVTNLVESNGSFELTVPLIENRLNRLFVSAVDELGVASPLAPLDILQDSTPPHLFIDYPTNNSVVSAASTLVAGRIGDAHSGFLGLMATVEGEAARVDVGIGPSGTYERADVPLAIGTNTLRVIATDRLGNSTPKEVVVVRRDPTGPRLAVVSGDRQETNILRRLAQPLVVKLTDESDGPLADKIVQFQVTRSDGRLQPADPTKLAADNSKSPNYSTNGSMTVEIRTDSQGEAAAWWRLGMDAGHGNQRVSVTSTESTEAVMFSASALALPAKQINIGSGNYQRGETLSPAPEPLKVWVSDGNNPAAGVEVVFTVRKGSGKLIPIVTTNNTAPEGPGLRAASRPSASIALGKKAQGAAGASEVRVLTSITGHAEVDFSFGIEAGEQSVEAMFNGNVGMPARFTMNALVRRPGQPTTFTGIIQDNASQPIGGARCELVVGNATNVVVSDSQGRFAFLNLPSGSGHLFVNGATATILGTNTIPTNSFPPLQYTTTLVPNAENSLPTPVLLPRLNPVNAQWYAGTNDLVLNCEGVDGLKMMIVANSMRHPNGLLVTPERPAFVSLNQVHHDDIPMPMPDGASPPFAWTLQPGGATFDPPVHVEYPNMSGLAPGAAAFFLSFNHDTERFEIVSSGHVTEDGSRIVTDFGSGLTISGWGCNCPPYAVATDCSNEDFGEDCGSGEPCQACDNPFQRYNPQTRQCEPYTCGGGEWSLLTQIDPVTLFRMWWVSTEILEKTRENLENGVYDGQPVDANRLVNAHRHIWWQCALTQMFGRSTAEAAASAHEGGSHADQAFGTSACGPIFENAPCNEDHLIDLWNNDIGRQLGSDPNVSDCEQAALDAAFGNISGIDPALYLTPLFREQVEISMPFCEQGALLKAKSIQSARAATAACPTLSVNASEITLRVGETGQIAVMRTDCSGTAVDVTQEGTNTLYYTWQGTIEVSDSGLIKGLAAGEASIIVAHLAGANGPLLAQVIDVHVLDRNGNPTTVVTPNSFSTNLWQVSINGQVGAMTGSRGFRVSNISAPDAFGPAGPGSQPDFVGDDFVRAILVSNVSGKNYYLFSEFFRLRQGETAKVKTLTPTTTPPRQPELLEIIPDTRLMTAIGQTNRMKVIAHYADGTTNDVTGAKQWTSYRLSNPNLATVNGDGMVTAKLEGTVLVTAVNEGATAVIELTISIGDQGATLLGRAVDGVGAGVSGAEVILRAGDLERRTVTGNDGSYTFAEIPSSIGPAVLSVIQQAASGRLVGVARVDVNAGGPIEVPNMTLTPFQPRASGAFAGGYRHTMAIQSDGSLWAWGEDDYGQLGNGDGSGTDIPAMLGADRDWLFVANTWNHTLALKTDGSLWGWGYNVDGSVGNGSYQNVRSPVRIGSNTDWAQLAGGGGHTVAVKRDGTLWAWGRNNHGQLGTGDLTRRNTPIQIGTDANWRLVVCGDAHTLGIRTDGSLWAWGFNIEGQLGDGSNVDRNQPVQVGTDGDWQLVAAGAKHTMAMKADGSLWGWGYNISGEVGYGQRGKTNTPVRIGSDRDWAAVVCGESHTVALKTDGALWSWGQNYYGQLGNASGVDGFVPARVGMDFDWVQIAAGGSHTLAQKSDSSLWAWGLGLNGQLGNQPIAALDVPGQIGSEQNWRDVSAGESHTLALKTDGSLWAWGYNLNGQIGSGNYAQAPVPIQIGASAEWSAISTGDRYSTAVKANGTLWAWGLGTDGQLGNGANETIPIPIQIGTDTDWRSVAAGRRHTMAIKTDGSLWGWGANLYGQLGNQDPSGSDSTVPVPVGNEKDWLAVACGESHTTGLKTDGSLWAWGYNLDGRLGLGNTSFGEGRPIRIGTDTNWRWIATSTRNTAALKADGSLWIWGENTQGQLGNGVFGGMATSPTQVGTEQDWAAVSCGDNFTLAIKNDGSLWGWGFNFEGMLANGTRDRSASPIRAGTLTNWKVVGAGGGHAIGIQTDKSAHGWGSNLYGQIAQPVSFVPRAVPGRNVWAMR